MRITKDEAAIIASLISNCKYYYKPTEGNSPLFEAITDLEERIEKSSKDQRRVGRTSQDDISDVFKRFIKAHQNGTN